MSEHNILRQAAAAVLADLPEGTAFYSHGRPEALITSGNGSSFQLRHLRIDGGEIETMYLDANSVWQGGFPGVEYPFSVTDTDSDGIPTSFVYKG